MNSVGKIDRHIPEPEELVARAREIAQLLQDRGPEADSNQNVHEDTVRRMADAGLFRILQPKRWGGYEMPPSTFFQVQLALAESCMSTGWIYGVIGVHPFQLALFDDLAQEEVWGQNTGTLVSSSYQPAAKIQIADGGFNISGKWSFSSGCKHCHWVLLGGLIPAEISETGVPDVRTFLIPRADYRIEDNWDVLGLKATGSHDIVVHNAFVPDYRSHKLMDGFLCENPGNKLNTAALYRIPWAQIFVCSVSTSAIGATRGALEDYLKIAAKRIPSFADIGTVYDPIAQSLVAEAERQLDSMYRTLFANMDSLYMAANGGAPNTIEERVKFRYDSAVVVEQCAELVTNLQHNLGGRGIYSVSPLIRRFLDLHAARAHVANGPAKFAYNLGAIRLGLDNQDYFI